MTQQLSGEFVNLDAFEIVEFTTSEIENRGSDNRTYTIASAIEYFSIHDRSPLCCGQTCETAPISRCFDCRAVFLIFDIAICLMNGSPQPRSRESENQSGSRVISTHKRRRNRRRNAAPIPSQ
jgi:hypothetical protein